MPREGGYAVTFDAPDSDVSFRFPTQLKEGETTWAGDGIPGTIAGLQLAWDGPNGGHASAHVAPDGEGRAIVTRFPAGDVHLFHYERAGAPPVTLIRGVVRAGETTRLSLP